MNYILIDSSVWIDFFKGLDSARALLDLIDTNRICINDLILSELIPSINHRKEKQLADLLFSIHKVELSIDWQNIIDMQTVNLKNGINRVGTADLIIAQNAIRNDLRLYAVDKHFSLMSDVHGYTMYTV